MPINSGGQAATIDSNNNTLITYSIVLPRPRKFYEFTVDVVNAWTVEVNHKLNGTKYATNRYIEEGYVYIDRPVPKEMRLFDTPSEAEADYFNNPFYLKYIIEEKRYFYSR